MHISSEVPGVLDLRSDGSAAPIETAAVPPSDASARGGLGGFFLGDGTTAIGAEAKIVDRNHYIIALLPIINASSKEEWQAALG